MSGLPPIEAVHEAALVAGVCVRPVISKVTDLETGERRMVRRFAVTSSPSVPSPRVAPCTSTPPS